MSSEEKCPECGEIDGHLVGCSKAGRTNIKVSVNRDSEIDSLHAELEEKKRLLAQIALNAFEGEKEKFKNLYPDRTDDIENARTPTELEAIKDEVLAEKSGSRKPGGPPPSGKASMSKPSTDEFEDQKALVDELYFKAYYDKNATKEEKREALLKIDELVTSMIKGKSWKQIQQGQSTLKKRTTFSMCPKCFRTLEDHDFSIEPCPHCGYELRKGK